MKNGGWQDMRLERSGWMMKGQMPSKELRSLDLIFNVIPKIPLFLVIIFFFLLSFFFIVKYIIEPEKYIKHKCKT